MGAKRRVGLATALSGALALVAIGPGVLTAHAVTCLTEEGIFWGVTVSGDTNFRTHTHGDRNLLEVSSRPVNQNCDSNKNLSGSTAHERLSVTAVNWAEVGWEKYRDGQYDVFAEWGLNGTH